MSEEGNDHFQVGKIMQEGRIPTIIVTPKSNMAAGCSKRPHLLSTGGFHVIIPQIKACKSCLNA